MAAGTMVQEPLTTLDDAAVAVMPAVTPDRIAVASARATSWALAVTTLVLASVALLVLVLNPRALWLALGVGLLAVGTRGVLTLHRLAAGPGRAGRAAARTAGAAPVANVGLGIALLAVAPLLAFALLWTALFLVIGAAWLLHLVGLA